MERTRKIETVLVLTDGAEVGAHVTTRVRELKTQAPDLQVHVLVPAPKWISSIHGRQVDGEERAKVQLSDALELFQQIGISATGEVGGHDPMKATKLVIPRVRPDLILVSTLPSGLSRWLTMDLPHRLARRFRIPVEYVMGKPVNDDDWGAMPRRSGGPLRILLVEDSIEEAKLMRFALGQTEERIDLTVVGNGAEAVEHVRANGQDEIDLVLLDLKMPKVDGHEFLEIMGQEFDVDALNVTVVTSSVSTEDRERAHALGAGAYVIKDPDIHAFKDAIQSVIDEVAES